MPNSRNPQEFFLELPLYSKLEWERSEVFSIVDLLYFRGTIDSYCLGCGRESTFHCETQSIPPDLNTEHYQKQLQLYNAASVNIGSSLNHSKPKPPLIKPGIYRVSFFCGRLNEHKLQFLYLIQNTPTKAEVGNHRSSQWLEKIGQYPSLADLNLPAIQKYRDVLSRDLYSDLARGIGLAAHDVGIGAYVYLRRVFERLVELAHDAASHDSGWNEDSYNQMRMTEKVLAVRNHLPSFLVSNPEMYSLLSKGLHELSEDECLRHFSALRVGIELILDQKIEEDARERKLKEASKAIKDATRVINGSGK